MGSTTTASLSFQPWTRTKAEGNALKDVLARVNLERDHFRDISEASLREEIAAEGALELSESEEEDEDGGAGQDAQHSKPKPTTREELFKAKNEMLANVKAAENEVLMSLDFVSFLLSKDAPKQAQSTISPVLKQNVPMGSLGADLWHRMPIDAAREAQDDLLATNVRMEGLQKSADSLLSGLTRLQTNVRKETQYWDQVLSISEKGWNVCRIPGQRHRLGVRYGFSESLPQFSNRGIATLNPSEDGGIALERGIGSKPKALRVVIRREGKVMGASRLPNMQDAEETTLEGRIRYARDSLFDEELYHEIIKESRTLASLGVGMEGSGIRFRCDDDRPGAATLEVELGLVSLGEHQETHLEADQNRDSLAQAIAIAARLLLSQAHWDRRRKRSEIPPPLSDKPREDDKKLPLPILRPIMSFIMHRTAISQLNNYLKAAEDILRTAGVRTTLRPAKFNVPEDLDVKDIEALVSLLLRPWTLNAELRISGPKDDSEIICGYSISTTLAQGHFGSTFSLLISSQPTSYRFSSIDELIAGTDAKLASALAKAMLGMLDDTWKCNEREALLIRDMGFVEQMKSMWVVFDSSRKLVKLSSLKSGSTWMMEGEVLEHSLWNAWGDLALS